jgi:hypothetical protein
LCLTDKIMCEVLSRVCIAILAWHCVCVYNFNNNNFGIV